VVSQILPGELSPSYGSYTSPRDPATSTYARFVRKTCAWALTSTGLSNRPWQHSRGRKEALGGSERAECARGRGGADRGPSGRIAV